MIPQFLGSLLQQELRSLFHDLCFTAQLSSASTPPVASEPQHLRDPETKLEQAMSDFQLGFTADIFCAPQQAHKRQLWWEYCMKEHCLSSWAQHWRLETSDNTLEFGSSPSNSGLCLQSHTSGSKHFLFLTEINLAPSLWGILQMRKLKHGEKPTSTRLIFSLST